MGSFNDEETVSLEAYEDPHDAYVYICDMLSFEEGNSPYAGHIGTSAGWCEFSDFPVTDRESLNKAREIIWKRTEKWAVYEHFIYNDQHYFVGWAAC